MGYLSLLSFNFVFLKISNETTLNPLYTKRNHPFNCFFAAWLIKLVTGEENKTSFMIRRSRAVFLLWQMLMKKLNLRYFRKLFRLTDLTLFGWSFFFCIRGDIDSRILLGNTLTTT